MACQRWGVSSGRRNSRLSTTFTHVSGRGLSAARLQPDTDSTLKGGSLDPKGLCRRQSVGAPGWSNCEKARDDESDDGDETNRG